MDITTDPKFQYFLSQRDLKPNTINKYRKDIGKYCEFLDLTPTELINQARNEQKQFDYEDERQITTHLSRYREHLKNMEYSRYSIKMALVNIKSFYHQFQIQTPNITIKGEPATYYLNIDDLPGYEEFRLFISLANLNYRAIFTIMGSSGMNISDVLNLKMGHLVNAVKYHYKEVVDMETLFQVHEKHEGIIPVWKVPRTKNEQPRVTFSSPESLKFIIDYIKSAPLADPDDFIFKSSKFRDKPITYQAVCKYTRGLNKDAGWKDKKLGYYNYITTKSFRTYFANTLEAYGVQEKYIRAMMGHAQQGIRQSYHKLNIPLLLEEYMKALPGLTFMENIQVVDKSKEQMEELRAEMLGKLSDLESKLWKEYGLELKDLPRPGKK